MSLNITILLIITLFFIYLTIDLILRKRHGKPMIETFFKDVFENRQKYFLAFEITVLGLLLLSIPLLASLPSERFFNVYSKFVIPFMGLLIFSSRSIEEYLYKRDNKDHVHSLLLVGLMISIMTVLFIVN
ncbi:hypothetical protein CR194_05920 [Salipaludibacillus keqinensis]|uniref:DUF4181 domain-containing protein n=1 Tax=Salipaludibacillus keqinensis TaxID=2045207 RepID=A0A323TKE1_9BACI|nr:hypothetical protein CR194_05920 [Salipaludibacillus keqinensis]